MTTIVYRNGVMAGDTAVFDRGTYCGEMRKVYKHDGWLLGGAGAVSEMVQFRDWFLDNREGKPPEVKADQSEFMIVSPTGVVHWCGSAQSMCEMTGTFFAIGSGFEVAVGAMAHGATALQAIEIAADLNNMTRRPIIVERLDNMEQFSR